MPGGWQPQDRFVGMPLDSSMVGSVGRRKVVCSYVSPAWESTGWSIFATPAVLETSVNL